MTRHSTLTNPNDLHYAKVRAFSGNPNAINPDFIDQLLAATDTNKIYRAVGTNLGALTELLPQSTGDGNGGANTAPVFVIDDIPPSSPFPPDGSLHFDSYEGILYVSAYGRWIGIRHGLDLVWSFSNNSPASWADLNPELLMEGNQILAIDTNSEELNSNLSKQILKRGLGYYDFAIAYSGNVYDSSLFSISSAQNFISGSVNDFECFYLSGGAMCLNYYPFKPVSLQLSFSINYSG